MWTTPAIFTEPRWPSATEQQGGGVGQRLDLFEATDDGDDEIPSQRYAGLGRLDGGFEHLGERKPAPSSMGGAQPGNGARDCHLRPAARPTAQVRIVSGMSH
jgi:hypothetical protein